ncbi:MAG: hypothetical protein J5734_01670, partial [Prevotella sp.]|nr:hypothetical protein [Prevotella sp.]
TDAYDQLSLLISQHPDSAVVYAARADLEVEREQYDPAEYDFTQALRLQPQQKDWLLARAQVRIKMKHFDDALDDLDRLVALGTPRTALDSFYQQFPKKKKHRR